MLNSLAHDSGWQAAIQIGISRINQRSTVAALRHHGPLRVQRPFHPEGPTCCHVYLLHPPGGMVTGDQLQIGVDVAGDAEVLLTTPSAGKVYRGDQSSRPQRQHCRLSVASAGVLEWLPQETVVFDGARGELITEIDLAAGARFIGWDIVCLGRPAAGETFTHGYLVQKLLVRREGRMLYHERTVFRGGSAMLQESWGLQGYPVSGSMMASLQLADDELDRLREQVAALNLPGLTAITQLDDGLLLVRHAGPESYACRQAFENVWHCLRPHLNARQAMPPRIWRT